MEGGVITPPAPPSSWDHASALLAGVLAIAVGLGDFHTGALLTGAGDAAMVLAGFAMLGVKAAIPGILPKG